LQDGFIHLTAEAKVLLSVGVYNIVRAVVLCSERLLTKVVSAGNHFYTAVPGKFILLVIEAAKLKAKVCS
jgi:uncharacterized protein (DUF952 family)